MLVIGAGGLGVPVLQYLCAMGVGRIGIVDGDHVNLSNLQRQVLYDTGDVDALKAHAAARRLRAMNPDITIDTHPVTLEPGNALDLLRNYELVIDATDVFSARYLINDACVMLGRPWVFGAVHQYEGQISVFNFQGGPTYRCLFPKQPGAEEIPDCETGGVLGVVPGLVGMRMALEAVKILAGIGKPLSGTVLMLDALHDSEYRMRLKPVAGNLRIAALQDSYADACDAVPVLHPEGLGAFMQEHAPLLLDVRSQDAFAAGHLAGAVSVPIETISARSAQLRSGRPVVLYCQRGINSVKALRQLLTLRPDLQAYSLAGGFDACGAELYGE